MLDLVVSQELEINGPRTYDPCEHFQVIDESKDEVVDRLIRDGFHRKQAQPQDYIGLLTNDPACRHSTCILAAQDVYIARPTGIARA